MDAILLVVPAVLGFLVPRWWVLCVAAVLPVALVAATEGLSTTTRGGDDNWALVILPLLCAASTAVCAGAIWLRTARRDG